LTYPLAYPRSVRLADFLTGDRAEVDRAREAASKDGYTLFNIACVLALLDSLEESLECLREARERGYYVQSELWSNTDLDPLRDMAGFKELTEH